MRRRAVPLCNPVDALDFVAPIRSVRYFGAAGRDAKSNASRKRRSFLETDGKRLSLNFQFRRSACLQGPGSARTSCVSILCHHPIAPRTLIGRAFDHMSDSVQEFFAFAINFALVPAG